MGCAESAPRKRDETGRSSTSRLRKAGTTRGKDKRTQPAILTPLSRSAVNPLIPVSPGQQQTSSTSFIFNSQHQLTSVHSLTKASLDEQQRLALESIRCRRPFAKRGNRARILRRKEEYTKKCQIAEDAPFWRNVAAYNLLLVKCSEKGERMLRSTRQLSSADEIEPLTPMAGEMERFIHRATMRTLLGESCESSDHPSRPVALAERVHLESRVIKRRRERHQAPAPK